MDWIWKPAEWIRRPADWIWESSALDLETSRVDPETSGLDLETNGLDLETGGLDRQTGGLDPETDGLDPKPMDRLSKPMDWTRKPAGWIQDELPATERLRPLRPNTFAPSNDRFCPFERTPLPPSNDRFCPLPVVLHEQPNQGKTIIEKFEHHADVDFAVVLLTPDDIGHPSNRQDLARPRARQNVVLELGFLMGTLGRHRVCVLHAGDLELPSDYSGVLYLPLDAGGAWRFLLAKEMKASGMRMDLNLAG